ncbi:MAG: hypothetical protein IJV64_01165, partial [Oscillospiraceae bacterium]|nr:hypothetical protein [Oscillospiraceae bacterium]
SHSPRARPYLFSPAQSVSDSGWSASSLPFVSSWYLHVFCIIVAKADLPTPLQQTDSSIYNPIFQDFRQNPPIICRKQQRLKM